MAFRQIKFISQESGFKYPDENVIIEDSGLEPSAFSESFSLSINTNIAFFSETSDNFSASFGLEATSSVDFAASQAQQTVYNASFSPSVDASISFSATSQQETLYNASFSIPVTSSINFVAAQ